MASAKPLFFTFGNHSHWVDMQWLWGYQVQPDSIDDMLALCDAVDVKGNVNFDGVGYEKLAAEDPEALSRLRAAVEASKVEVVGATYGQPYGLFCGGESNIRQQIVGAQVVRRLLGVWPRTFWEEEFDFFPQLPQILRGCGFTGASLFFQWTWHTPHVPEEEAPLVTWEGIDGTRLPAVAKTKLCLHQWPEDFDGRLELAAAVDRPALVQWLELIPSPDWMCRSELLLPRLRELFQDPRFSVRAVTLGELIAALDDGEAPVRRYTMDDVFHGMTIGKNGDVVPRASDEAEARILEAESLAAAMGVLGRPYASWEVYPTWELDEAWRELLQAQHHDNHECESLCGSIGKLSFNRAFDLADDVHRRHLDHLSSGFLVQPDACLIRNPSGWSRDIAFGDPWDERGGRRIARDVPAFGWRVVRRDDPTSSAAERVESKRRDGALELRAGDLAVTVDASTGTVCMLEGPGVRLPIDFGRLHARRHGSELELPVPDVSWAPDGPGDPGIRVWFLDDATDIELHVALRPDLGAARLRLLVRSLPDIDPGFGGCLRLRIGGFDGDVVVWHDTPLAVDRIEARGQYVRKYPSGDWMTSKQWFEAVSRPLTSRTFLDLETGSGAGLLCVHGGSQGAFRTDDGIDLVLNARDPWDGDYWCTHRRDQMHAQLFLVPHGTWTHSQRVRRAAEAGSAPPSREIHPTAGHRRLPSTFGPLVCEAPNVVVTALYREARKSLEHVPHAFGPGVRNPFVVRLVEFDGEPAEVAVKGPGSCPAAARTNLLGAIEQELVATPAEPPAWSPRDLEWSEIRLSMRPREIATVMLDLELGRHQPRDLDQHRHVWATVHRRES